MPVIKSAKKKLRQDKKREFQNQGVLNNLKSSLKKAHLEKTEKVIIEAIKIADKAAKKNIIHKNKAARIKSSLSKIMLKKTDAKIKKPKKQSSSVETAAAL